ncbi:MAG: bifunctional 5,10-methylenetetrahydrofolate dehydrogenase/5,10-methenyltetrahydrofolate cyclohydrolase [Parachlamydia sp.]|nr:bifunctional 5,10-methylenetetrahydrofolate dehydrogenase/5,10-methenyltetrahydrofolate cyclohydrolase [Parachlamydia sp.]
MIIDGKAIAQSIQDEIRARVAAIPGRKPCLAVVLVGDHAPSHIYVNRKVQACAHAGILSLLERLPASTTEQEILATIEKLNHASDVDGILVQLPLPPHINPNKINVQIHPDKDVDGLHPMNIGKLLIGESDGFVPCTPLGIKVLLQRSNVDLTGQHAVILGRSNIVGKPMAALLMQSNGGGNATVTIAHRFSQDIAALCRLADLLIVAIGNPGFVKGDMVKEGAVVIDVGINKIEDPAGYRIVGDVDFPSVQEKCSLITPVPGGVGPMTIAMLLSNTLQGYERH